MLGIRSLLDKTLADGLVVNDRRADGLEIYSMSLAKLLKDAHNFSGVAYYTQKMICALGEE